MFDICTTRYGVSVGFVADHAVVSAQVPVQWQVGRQTYLAGGGPFAKSGPIVFLPKCRLSEEETIELILRDMHGVEISAPEPEWMEEFVAPGQEDVDRAIA